MAHKFEVYKDGKGEFRVRFKHNSEVIFSTESYATKAGAHRAVESIKKYVPEAPVTETEAVVAAAGGKAPAKTA